MLKNVNVIKSRMAKNHSTNENEPYFMVVHFCNRQNLCPFVQRKETRFLCKHNCILHGCKKSKESFEASAFKK